jgi:hypothetical protein
MRGSFKFGFPQQRSAHLKRLASSSWVPSITASASALCGHNRRSSTLTRAGTASPSYCSSYRASSTKISESGPRVGFSSDGAHPGVLPRWRLRKLLPLAEKGRIAIPAHNFMATLLWIGCSPHNIERSLAMVTRKAIHCSWLHRHPEACGADSMFRAPLSDEERQTS